MAAAVACGDAICRLEAQRFAGDSAELRLDEVLHGAIAWEGQRMMKVDEASGEVTIYLMREGLDIPAVDDEAGLI